MVIFTTLFTCTFAIKFIFKGEAKPGFVSLNQDNFLDTIGFSFYAAFEGIGSLLPIMKETKQIKHFPNIVKASLITLSIYYTFFGMICYLYFGNTERNPIVLDNFKTDTNKVQINITRFLFCLNLISSYPLTIYPTNQIVETFLFRCMEANSVGRKWLKNASRIGICAMAAFMAI